ncbi:MAG: hypothetical protein ACFB0C_16125 [Leptolyngbyaceae cyanobacterium]
MSDLERNGPSRLLIFCIAALVIGIGLFFYGRHRVIQQAERDYPGLLGP